MTHTLYSGQTAVYPHSPQSITKPTKEVPRICISSDDTFCPLSRPAPSWQLVLVVGHRSSHTALELYFEFLNFNIDTEIQNIQTHVCNIFAKATLSSRACWGVGTTNIECTVHQANTSRHLLQHSKYDINCWGTLADTHWNSKLFYLEPGTGSCCFVARDTASAGCQVVLGSAAVRSPSVTERYIQSPLESCQQTFAKLYSARRRFPLVTFPCLFLHFLTFPYLTFSSIWLPFLTFPYLSLPFLTFPYISLPFLTFPYLSLPFLTFTYLSLPFLTFPCLILHLHTD